MMKRIGLLGAILVLALLAAPALAGNTMTATGNILAPPPVAQFIGAPTTGTAPLTVQFTDQSTGTITGWAWDFNNDGVVDSTAQSPSFTYNTAGTYTVKLTVTGPGGSNSLTKTNYITVNVAPPVAAFTATPTSGYVPLTVQFTDQSTNSPASWKWEYQLGSGTWTQFSTAQSPSYAFTATGTYSIRLTVSNTGGSNSITKMNLITVTMPPKPVAAFTAAPTSGYVPLTVQFTDQSTNSPTSWKWEYMKPATTAGTGTWTQFSTAQNPSYTFSTTGIYSIRLTVTNVAGSSNLTKTNYITVTQVPAPVAAFIATPTSGYAPLTVQFTDQSTNNPTSWKWEYKLGSGSWTQFATAQSPSYTFTSTGTYSIRLTATNAGGSGNLTKSNYLTVSALPKPVAAFTATPTSGMPPLAVQFIDQSTNNPTSWKWEYQLGSGTWTQFSTARNPSYTFTALGQYGIRLTATNAAGSGTVTKSGYITVGHCGVILPYFTGSPTSGSHPLTVRFTDGSTGPIDSWQWDFQNDGTTDSTVQNPSFTYTTKNKYSVKLTVMNACATGTMIRINYINVA